MAKHKITENQLLTVNKWLGPTAKFGIRDDVIAEVELLSVLEGSPDVMELSQRGAEQFIGRPTHELFAHIRKTWVYDAEWELLTQLHEESPGDLRMARIALSAQFAVEACGVYPFLEADAHKWLREKFKDQGVPNFEAAWRDYMGIKDEVMLGHRRIYERAGLNIHVVIPV